MASDKHRGVRHGPCEYTVQQVVTSFSQEALRAHTQPKAAANLLWHAECEHDEACHQLCSYFMQCYVLGSVSISQVNF